LAITDGASGTGPGTVSFVATENTGYAIRTGVVAAAGWNFTITEAALPCSFSVTPTNKSTSWGGASLSFSVSTGAGCAWTAASYDSWAVVKSGATGSGPGTVTVTVGKNPGALRTTTLAIAGRSVALTQDTKPGNK
jgi:hypothetical protein